VSFFSKNNIPAITAIRNIATAIAAENSGDSLGESWVGERLVRRAKILCKELKMPKMKF